MLSIKEYMKSYGDLEVLKGVDLHIDQGDVVAIIGPSGSGKSTLLKSINYLTTPDNGTLSFSGQVLSPASATHKQIHNLRKDMGMVFQNFALFSHLTALENLTLVLEKVQKKSKKDAIKIAQTTLDSVGLSDKYNAYPSQLSGGQQQRVGIARAITTNPKLILFDEPTSALDPELVNEVQKVIRELANAGQTMIIVTHEMAFAKEVAKRIIFMENGEIVDQGTPDYIFSEAASTRLQKFVGKFSA